MFSISLYKSNWGWSHDISSSELFSYMTNHKNSFVKELQMHHADSLPFGKLKLIPIKLLHLAQLKKKNSFVISIGINKSLLALNLISLEWSLEGKSLGQDEWTSYGSGLWQLQVRMEIFQLMMADSFNPELILGLLFSCCLEDNTPGLFSDQNCCSDGARHFPGPGF